MAKLNRKAHALYVDASMNGVTTDWYLIGKDIEELSIDLGPQVDTVENILGETSVRDNGYQPAISAEPYYADPAENIYEPLVDIAMNRKKGDDCKSKYLEVIIADPEDTEHIAWQEDCILKPTSVGGDTSGLAIPFSIYPNGNRKQGKVTITGGKPTFTAD